MTEVVGPKIIQPSKRDCSVRPRGFTLLEVLLALSLSVLLLTAVYGAFDLYLRMATSSSDDIEQAQIARALLRKMEIDIRSVVLRENAQKSSLAATSSSDSESSSSGSDTSSNSKGGSAGTASKGAGNAGKGGTGGSSASKGGTANSGASDANATTAEPTDPAAGFSSSMTGLTGDAQTLVLHVDRAFRKSAAAVDVDQQEQIVGANSGQERSVSYFLADTGASGLAGVVGDMYRDQNSTGDVQGLARLEGNRLLIQLSDAENDQEALAAHAALLSRDVVGLQFRYFDGIDWYDNWDAALNSSLPQAVEITLVMLAPARNNQSESSRTDLKPVTRNYTLSVAVPAAKPYVSTAQ